MKEEENKFTEKEKYLFFAGIFLGVVGGIIGNMWVAFSFEFLHYPTKFNLTMFGLYTLALVICMSWLYKKSRNLIKMS